MTRWKTLGLAAALFGAAGLGAAVTPAATAQTVRTDEGQPRVFELFAGSPRIGISVKDVAEEDIKRNRLSGPGGALVSGVQDETPAATAGFRAGDIVVEFDGERVRSARQLTRLVQETPGGRAVQAVLLRDGERTSLTVTPREGSRPRALERLRDLEELGRSFRYERSTPPNPPSRPGTPRPPRAPLPREFDEFGFGRSSSRLGITVDQLTDQLAAYFGTKAGVLVTAVRDDSVAAKAGMKAGDVITSFNGSLVDSPSELRRRIQRVGEGGEFTIEVMRDRKPVTVKGKIEAGEERRRTFRSIV